MRAFVKGDRIKCLDKDDCGETGISLSKQGYLWDFEYEKDEKGETVYFIVIKGREK